jgi:hypothetical protein
VSSSVEPSAQHCDVWVGHERSPIAIPLRRVRCCQVLPPLVVLTPTATRFMLPTTQQSDVLAHETPLKKTWRPRKACLFQLIPPSVLATTPRLHDCVMPTPQQSDVLGQETPQRSVPVRTVVQVLPPSVVTTTSRRRGHDCLVPVAKQYDVLAQEIVTRSSSRLRGTSSFFQVLPPSVVATMTP